SSTVKPFHSSATNSQVPWNLSSSFLPTLPFGSSAEAASPIPRLAERRPTATIRFIRAPFSTGGSLAACHRRLGIHIIDEPGQQEERRAKAMLVPPNDQAQQPAGKENQNPARRRYAPPVCCSGLFGRLALVDRHPQRGYQLLETPTTPVRYVKESGLAL